MNEKLERTHKLVASLDGAVDEISRLSAIAGMSATLDADFACLANLLFDRRALEQRIAALRLRQVTPSAHVRRANDPKV